MRSTSRDIKSTGFFFERKVLRELGILKMSNNEYFEYLVLLLKELNSCTESIQP